MQIRNEPTTKIVNERSFISCSASSPSTSRTETLRPSLAGGVCGSASAKSPSATEAIAAIRNCVATSADVEIADDIAGRDPPERAPGPHAREFGAGNAHLMERERVAQRQRRHEAQGVADQRGVEGDEIRQRRHIEEERRAQQMEERENALGGEEPVSNQADEERRDHRGERRRAVGRAALPSGEVQRLQQVGAHRHVPGSPDEVLEEHHHGELQAYLAHTKVVARLLPCGAAE